jgi:hypothetical protein
MRGMNLQALLSTIILAGMIGFAWRFHDLQNKKTRDQQWVGGAISWPKSFWLAYAVGSWFFVPFLFLLDPHLPEPLRWVLIAHLASWWIRGALEMVMIYRWFNWTPIYGISHDTLHNVVIMAGTFYACAKIGWESLHSTPIAFWCVFYLAILCFAMMAEVVFAALFLTTRGKGENKIYFASDSSEYRMINRLTFIVCIVVYSHMIIQTSGLLFGFF